MRLASSAATSSRFFGNYTVEHSVIMTCLYAVR